MKGLLYRDRETDKLTVRPFDSDQDSDHALPLHYDDNKTDPQLDRRVNQVLSTGKEIEVDYSIVEETRMWGTKRYAKLATV